MAHGKSTVCRCSKWWVWPCGSPVLDTLEILHRDDHLLVINKPAEVSLLADRSGAPGLWEELPRLLNQKPYLVHRIDKPTSGVLLIALNPETQRRLNRAFQARKVRKFYLAWVVGQPRSAGVIELPLRKGRKNRFRVAGPRAAIVEHDGRWSLQADSESLAKDGHPSTTRFRVIRRANGRALLLLAPKTGRTHQLRVHLSWIGHPIIGDRIYGKPDDPAQRADRLYLHAHRIVLPEDGSYSAPIGGSWEI